MDSALDLLSIAVEITELIKSNELDAAIHRIEQANAAKIQVCVTGRSQEIDEINRAIIKAKTVQGDLRQAVLRLPSEERLFAEFQIERVIEQHFAPEISKLLERKRKISLPPR
jgi:hypothetical protein